MTTADLHPQLARFAKVSATDLSVQEVADILGLSYETTLRLVRRKAIAAMVLEGARGYCAKQHRVTKSAVFTFIIRSWSGEAALLLDAVQVCCKDWRGFAERVLAQPASAVTTEPENVIRMPRARTPRLPGDPYAGHPDLFRAAQ